MLVDLLIEKRFKNPFCPGIKVNLYRDYEYRAMAKAVSSMPGVHIESVMVGDSYFMTHQQCDSTKLTLEQSQLAKKILPELIAEVRKEIDKNEFNIRKPMLMADVPSGLNRQEIVEILNAYKDAGAESIKMEPESISDFWILKKINKLGLIPVLHLGYSPQWNENKTYGTSVEEINNYRCMIDTAYEFGTKIVIFERLTEIANQILTKYSLQKGVLSYSIFSGRSNLGGQSLNIWDAVVKANLTSIFFPPTSVITREMVEEKYNEELIAICFGQLLKLALANVFPPSPRNNLALDSCLNLLNVGEM